MHTRVAIIAAMLALLGGCASETSPPGAAPAGEPPDSTADGNQPASNEPEPCSLLTRDEINAATGSTFHEGAINASVTQELMAACDWQGPGVGIVQVLISTVDVYDGSKQAAAGIYGATTDVSIPGTERAYVIQGGFLIGMDMGGNFLQVSYITTDADVAAVVLDLATKAADRMS